MRKRLLVVDDEEVIRDIVRDALGRDFTVSEARDRTTGLAALLHEVPDVLITDVRMPGGGEDLVREAVARFPDLAVIVVTGHAVREDFVRLFRLGVSDYLIKPFTMTALSAAVARALEMRSLRGENALLRSAVATAVEDRLLIGESEAMRTAVASLERVAATDATVLITGSSGVGKELAARTVHDRSRRASGPFVPVHCGALSPELLDSELFGHARGAFTGAERARRGRFEEADGGTLFLDEVGTMPEATQVRLLRALSQREVTRLGETGTRPVNVRVVAATNADLAAMVAAGKFRQDLLFRLNVFPIRLPDLKERPDDILLLARRFVERCCERLRIPLKTISQGAMRRLTQEPWPGNVRELENVIERAVILSRSQVIEEADLLVGSDRAAPATELDIPPEGMDLPAELSEIEQDLIAQALERTGGNRQQAARLLGLPSSTLTHKLRRQPDGADS